MAVSNNNPMQPKMNWNNGDEVAQSNDNREKISN